MRQTFYQFMLRYTDSQKKDMQTQFANLISEDVAFPKHADQYDDIVHYVELTEDYLPYMHVFDELWEVYQELNQI